MIIGDLFSADKGSIGRIYWTVRRVIEMSEEKKQEIRQKSIADTLNAALQNAMYNQNSQMDGAIQRGWLEGNKQINILEDQTHIQSEVFMIGDPSTLARIFEIETTPGFLNWTNPHLIDEIKKQN